MTENSTLRCAWCDAVLEDEETAVPWGDVLFCSAECRREYHEAEREAQERTERLQEYL